MAAEHPLLDRLAGGLRVLVADENRAALDDVAAVLAELGHEVASREVSPEAVGERIAAERPDIALVKLHGDDEHALDLIEQAVETARCPVVALLEHDDPDFVSRAAERGITAYAQPVDATTVQSALELSIRRYAELAELGEAVGQLESALPRRATIERAKGILMERHAISEREAFERLRSAARSTNRTVHELAREVAAEQEQPAR